MANIVYIIVLSIVITCAIIKEIKKMKDELIYKRKKEKGMRGYHAQPDRGTLSIILGCIREILNAPLKKVLIWLGTIALILLIIFITLKVRGEI